MSLPRFTRLALVAVACLVTAACGQSNTPTNNTAAPQRGTTAQDSAARTAPAVDAGVQERLDMSPDEIQQIQHGYEQCLSQHGVASLRAAMANPTDADRAAITACASKKPLPPPEMDPAKNPDFNDQQHEYQKCLDKHGINANTPEDTYASVSHACELQAFGHGNG